jgi:flagellar motility protein MotE (MotC chaperone)
MKSVLRHIRLLPAVIAVSAVLLGLKGEGLVRTAWAQEQSDTTTKTDAALLSQDTAPLPKDVADTDSEGASAAEVDVLTSLAKRRSALDARAADLKMRADVIAAAETRVDGKISTLKQLQDQINKLLAQRDSEQEKQVASLVKTYSAMRPKDAARIFDNLSDDVLIPVAQEMKSDALAPILAAMTPDNAQKLTVKLANRLNLPQLAAPAVATAAPVCLPQTANAAPAANPAAPPAATAQTPAPGSHG